MDSTTDLHINCAVRKVLVRHWIDLGQLTLRSTRGVVRLSGAFCRLCNAGGELNCGALLTILSEIKRLPHVKRITTDFSNWIATDVEGWKPIGPATSSGETATAAPSATKGASQTVNVYEVKEKLPESDEPE